MALTAAQLLVKVKADTSDAKTGIADLADLLTPGGMLGLGAAAAVTAIGAMGIASIKMAGDFQAGITSLSTGAGESAANLKLVSDGILQMSQDTGTSTQQLISGMYMIESAGFHGKAGLDVLRAAAEGAKVGNADLGTVADATTTILKDYPGVMNGASGAVNALVATVASGKTHMQDLATSLAQILPTSSAAHVGLTDVMGAMATMTGEGVPAANAATYLRQTILALDAPSKAAQKALKSVGLSSSEVASEMQKSLPGALQMITDAVAKKFPPGSAAYVQALKNIAGGSKQMQGMLDLTGGHLKDFKANVDNVGGAVNKNGKTISGWNEVQGDFNFKMDKAKSVVEALMIQLGQKLLPVASRLADMFASNLPGAVKTVTGAFQNAVTIGQNLIKFFQDTGPVSTAVKIALLAITGAALGMAASGIPAAITAIMASVTAFGAQAIAAGAAAIATLAAAAPFLLIGAAIGAVVGIIILAVTHWKQITTALGHFKDKILSVPGPIKILAAILLGPIGIIILLVTHLKQVGQALGNFKNLLGNMLGAIGGFVGSAIAWMVKMGKELPAKIGEMVLSLLGHLKDMVTQGLLHFGEMELNGLKVLARMAVSLPGKAKDMVTTLLGHLKDMAIQALQHFGQLELNGLKVLARMVISIPAKVRDMVTGALGHLKDMAVSGLKSVGQFELNIVNKAKQLATNFISALAGLPGKLLDLGKQLMTKLAQGIASAGGAVLSALKNIPGIGGLIGNLGGIIPKFATGTVDAPGGLAYVHKDELIELPAHSKVHTANETRQMLGGGAGSGTLPAGLAGGAGGGQMVIQIQHTTTLDGRVVAQSVVKHIPTVLRNATGTRAF